MTAPNSTMKIIASHWSGEGANSLRIKCSCGGDTFTINRGVFGATCPSCAGTASTIDLLIDWGEGLSLTSPPDPPITP